MFEYQTLAALAAGWDVADVPCPACGPNCRTPRNRVRSVLRVWCDPGFITFHCNRCQAKGYVREDETRPIDREALRRRRIAAAARQRKHDAERLALARRLWNRRRPITGTPVEPYLRRERGLTGEFPPTLACLPGDSRFPAAMIGAFAMVGEREPGVLAAVPEHAVVGVHLTKLGPDGRKADAEPVKIMIGPSRGTPIILAPMNDLLGLAVVEGIEDGLSIVQATGLGVWVAGSWSRMEALADLVPAYTDCVTVVEDDDPDGRRGARALAERLAARGLHCEVARDPGALR